MYKQKTGTKKVFHLPSIINADPSNAKHRIAMLRHSNAATSKFITFYSYVICIDHHRQHLVIKCTEIDPNVNTIPIPGKKSIFIATEK